MASFFCSNVVGYQNLDMVGSGITWAISTMPAVGVDLEEQTLAQFKVPTNEAFVGGDSIVLEIYGSDGTLEGAYSFVDEANCETYSLTNPGWYPLDLMQQWTATDDDLSNDVVVPYGKGVIITSGEADSTVTFSGEVLAQEKTYEIVGSGITWTGNATPVDLKLKDFAIPTDSSFVGGDSIVLEIYGSDGTLVGAYSFVDEANCESYSLTTPGWYPLDLMQQWTATDDDCANETVTIPAGKMVIITSGEADTTLTLPSPL